MVCMTASAQQHRDQAAEHERLSAESFARSDTDGFLTQWANDLAASRHRLEADLADNSGRWEFPALFDLDGQMVAAKLIDTRYGSAWLLLDTDDPESDSRGIVGRSTARKAARRRQTMEAKGYREGIVRARARVTVVGGSDGTGLAGAASVRYGLVRADHGFSRDAAFVRWDEQDW